MFKIHLIHYYEFYINYGLELNLNIQGKIGIILKIH